MPITSAINTHVSAKISAKPLPGSSKKVQRINELLVLVRAYPVGGGEQYLPRKFDLHECREEPTTRSLRRIQGNVVESPDSKRIAFQGIAPGKPWKMYLVSAEGGGPLEVLPGYGDVGWSPDGNSLVFSDTPRLLDPAASGKFALHVMDLKTRQVSSLPDSQGLYSPRWSPDGRYIAALRAGPETLTLFDFSTHEWIGQTTSVTVGYPNWSRDSRYIHFDAPGADPAFYRVRISDRKLERLVSLKDVRRSGFFGWTGLAPDDSPMLVRDVGTEEIYALDWQAP